MPYDNAPLWRGRGSLNLTNLGSTAITTRRIVWLTRNFEYRNIIDLGDYITID